MLPGNFPILTMGWGKEIKKLKPLPQDKWNAPVNMGAPINSPFDDLFFVE